MERSPGSRSAACRSSPDSPSRTSSAAAASWAWGPAPSSGQQRAQEKVAVPRNWTLCAPQDRVKQALQMVSWQVWQWNFDCFNLGAGGGGLSDRTGGPGLGGVGLGLPGKMSTLSQLKLTDVGRKLLSQSGRKSCQRQS